MIFVLMALGLFLAAFGVQWLLLYLTGNRFRILAFAPLLAVAAFWYAAWTCFHTPSMFNLNDLTAFAYGAAGCLILLGWVLAWVVFGRKR